MTDAPFDLSDWTPEDIIRRWRDACERANGVRPINVLEYKRGWFVERNEFWHLNYRRKHVAAIIDRLESHQPAKKESAVNISDEIVEKAIAGGLSAKPSLGPFLRTEAGMAFMRDALEAVASDLGRTAVLAEREACAKLADDGHRKMDGYEIACAIRCRTEKDVT